MTKEFSKFISVGSFMTMTIAPDQIERIVWNQHHDRLSAGFPISRQDGKTVWVVRAYLPNANAAWVVFRKNGWNTDASGIPTFECTIDPRTGKLPVADSRREHERVIYDPYAFRSPRLTNLTCIYLGRKSSPVYEN